MLRTSSWFQLTAEAVVCKELTKQLRGLTDKRNQERGTKTLQIIRSSMEHVKAINNKWRKWSTRVTLSRTGCSFKHQIKSRCAKLSKMFTQKYSIISSYRVWLLTQPSYCKIFLFFPPLNVNLFYIHLHVVACFI